MHDIYLVNVKNIFKEDGANFCGLLRKAEFYLLQITSSVLSHLSTILELIAKI